MSKQTNPTECQQESAVRRPVVGWINDCSDWSETIIDLCDLEEMDAEHHQFGLMKEFFANPRRCDIIVLDIGEIGRMSITMPKVCDYCNSIVLVSAMTLPSTLTVVEMVQESYPDTHIRYAGLDPEVVLTQMLS